MTVDRHHEAEGGVCGQDAARGLFPADPLALGRPWCLVWLLVVSRSPADRVGPLRPFSLIFGLAGFLALISIPRGKRVRTRVW